MKILTYRIRLQEPTLVTALEGDPNSAVAFNYLPGSVLRGVAVAKHLGADANRIGNLDATDPVVRRLFFDGTTRFLNGYPVGQRGRRALPTPLSWYCEKGNEIDIVDFAIEPPDRGEGQWHSVQGPFCHFGDGSAHLFGPARHVAVHTRRTPRFGRAMPAGRVGPDETPGAVYRYDALASGQVFEAAVIGDDLDMPVLRQLLHGEITLGGSRSAGYGRAALEDVQEVGPDWREVGGALQFDEEHLVVTLLSDALFQNDLGQFVVDQIAVTQAVSRHLDASLEPRAAFLRAQPVGGFNRKWGLPLPQALAVSMGSVLVYKAPVYKAPGCHINRLRDLEIRGIGQRRAEGFGRVAVNWPAKGRMRADTDGRVAEGPLVKIPAGVPGEALAKLMVARMLRARLDERVIEAANRIAVGHPPKPAQLSRLRSIIRDELMQEAPDPQRVGAFLQGIRDRRTPRQQYESARVGGRSLLDWLEQAQRSTSEEAWRELIGFRAGDARTVGGVAADLGLSLRIEYLLRLIDAVLARAAKEGGS